MTEVIALILFVDYYRQMELIDATKYLAALSQETRLRAFRLLVVNGNTGLAAGKIADALDIPHNTMSTHLAILLQAGLINSERQSRSIIYRINMAGIRNLMSFLLEDCCQGNKELCQPLLDSIQTACCEPETTKLPGKTK
jgi:ArsR family transcriptional regulator, arsenate/arsenite/antimonite-responsive transcriptional repressor